MHGRHARTVVTLLNGNASAIRQEVSSPPTNLSLLSDITAFSDAPILKFEERFSISQYHKQADEIRVSF